MTPQKVHMQADLVVRSSTRALHSSMQDAEEAPLEVSRRRRRE